MERSTDQESHEGDEDHSHLLTVLGYAQQCGVDLLHIRWQPALEKIGLGGTAEIRQTLVNLQFSFAFKRVKPLLKQPRRAKHALKRIVAEIVCLSQPAVRGQRHILSLKALCWDVADTNKEVWPVLVFEKYELGNLEHFLLSEGQVVGIHERLKLCGHLALALKILHGDVKPANVLLTRDVDGSLVAKLSDFGNAVRRHGGRYVKIPQSRPFNAPEYTHREVDFEDARKQEAYCFGMSCLWILFHDRLEKLKADDNASTQPYKHDIREQHQILTKHKFQHTIEHLIQSLVEEDDVLSLADKSRLKKGLLSVLAFAPQNRLFTWEDAFESFQVNQTVEPCTTTNDLSLIHPEFSIAENIRHLHRADVKIRQCLLSTLESQMGRYVCGKCNRICARNVAFCYAIGFGAPLNEQRAFNVLEEAGIPATVLRTDKEVVLAAQFKYRARELDFLAQEGFLLPLTHANDYKRHEDLRNTEAELAREVKDAKTAFGDNDPVVFDLSVVHVGILLSERKFQQAEDMLLHLERSVQRSLIVKGSPNHQAGISIYDMLAELYNKRGLLEKAEMTYEKALQAAERIEGTEHQNTQTARQNLAAVLRDRGKLSEARNLQSKALASLEKKLGPGHPSTLTARGNLATLLDDFGDLEGGEALHRQTFEGRVQALGLQHPDTLASLIIVGGVLKTKGDFAEAEKLTMQGLRGREDLFGEDHPDTLLAMNSLALIYHAQGRFSDADAMIKRALHRISIVLGEDHPDTLLLMSNSAVMLKAIGNLVLAEETSRKAVELTENAFGKQNTRTLECSRVLAHTSLDLGRYFEAETIFRSIADRSGSLLGEEHPSTLTALNDLALILKYQGRYADSEDIYQKVLAVRLRILGNTNLDTLVSYQDLAVVLMCQGKNEEAEQMQRMSLDSNRAILGGKHFSTLTSLGNLGSLYFNMRRYDEAELHHREALEGFESQLGVDHPMSLTGAHNVGMALLRKDEFKLAEGMFCRAFSGRSRVLGVDHRETLSSKRCLADTLLNMGQYSDAEDHAKKLMESMLRINGPSDKETLNSMRFLAAILVSRDDHSAAADLYQRILEEEIELLGPNHPVTLTSLEKLMDSILFLGERSQVDGGERCGFPDFSKKASKFAILYRRMFRDRRTG